ncbi:hypothetical protein FRB99_008324 [Tulasnella sp. 403]|nr:hypothetical protein FRB99_008324 [Tulasnella sp. 403]
MAEQPTIPRKTTRSGLQYAATPASATDGASEPAEILNATRSPSRVSGQDPEEGSDLSSAPSIGDEQPSVRAAPDAAANDDLPPTVVSGRNATNAGLESPAAIADVEPTSPRTDDRTTNRPTVRMATGDDGTRHPVTNVITYARAAGRAAARPPPVHNPRRFSGEFLEDERDVEPIPQLSNGPMNVHRAGHDALPQLIDDIVDSLSDTTRARVLRRMSLAEKALVDATETDDSSEANNGRLEWPGLEFNVVTLTQERYVPPHDEAIQDQQDRGKRRARGERPLQDAQEDEDEHSARRLQERLDSLSGPRVRERVPIEKDDLRDGAGSTKLSSIGNKSITPARTAGTVSSKSKRPSTQIPKSGYLWEVIGKYDMRGKDNRMGGDPDSSSSSDSTGSSSSEPSDTSSESSSDSEGTRKRKKYKRKLYRKNRQSKKKSRHLKCPEPSTYDGSPNLQRFEQFVFEANQWLDMSNMPSKFRVTSLKRFLTGKAGSWFMEFVAINKKAYTLKRFFAELFDHCFPAHFRRQVRDRFLNCSQKERTVREFLREVRTLGQQLPDVDDVQMRLRFWAGSKGYLRVKWAESGYDPENNSLSELEEAAERFEQADYLRRKEENRVAGNSKHDHRRRHERRDQSRSQRHRKDEDRDSDSLQVARIGLPNGQKKKMGPKRDAKYDSRKARLNVKAKGPRLSRTEMDELRAEGKCFECREVGHRANDCPKRTSAPRPAIASSSVTFREIDQLVDIRDSLTAMAVNFDSMELVSDEEWAAEVEVSQMMEMEYDFFRLDIRRVVDRLNSVSTYSARLEGSTTPGSRFVLVPDASEFTLTLVDRQIRLHSHLLREWLTDPDWDPVAWYSNRVAEYSEQWSHLTPGDLPRRAELGQEISAQALGWMEVVLDMNAPYPGDPAETEVTPGRFSVNLFLDDLLIADSLLGRIIAMPHPPSYVNNFNISSYLREFLDLEQPVGGQSGSQYQPGLTPPPAIFDLLDSSPEPELETLPPLTPMSLSEGEESENETNGNWSVPEDLPRRNEHERDDDNEDPPSDGLRISAPQVALAVITRPGSSSRNTNGHTDVVDNVERNASRPKDFDRLVPKAIVVTVKINGQEARALIDSGSLADFMSTRLADQLALRLQKLEKAMPVQLAVSGSRSVINSSASVHFAYQNISETRRFDIINLDNYDIILGTPFLYQHKVLIGFNPSRVAIGSN